VSEGEREGETWRSVTGAIVSAKPGGCGGGDRENGGKGKTGFMHGEVLKQGGI